MTPYFQTHAVGLAYYVTMSVWALFELNMYYEGMRRRKGVTKRDRGSFVVFAVLGIPGWFLLLRSPSMFPRATIHPAAVAYWSGVVLIVIGASVRIWAILTLGRYFTPTVKTSADQTVVTSGPYRVVRHPGYAGGSLGLVGMGVVYGNWIGLVSFTVLLTAGLLYRIHVEEEALTAALGDPYRIYAAGHKRLVPFVW